MAITPRRTAYLNNRDLLKEIHKSKNSYCTFLKDTDHQFDLILPSLADVNDATIAEARKNRAERLARTAWEDNHLRGVKTRLEEHFIEPSDIPVEELVFRIITWDHIPLHPGRKKNPKIQSDFYVKLNFPPFQHYRFDEDNLVCVGKSHWEGGLHNGHFCREHGGMTNTLAQMFLKLCERYASKGNWRGYSYNEEMRAQALVQLSQVGLQFDEFKGNNPFAFYTSTISKSFIQILNTEKKNQDIRDDILEMNNLAPSYTRQTKNSMPGDSATVTKSSAYLAKNKRDVEDFEARVNSGDLFTIAKVTRDLFDLFPRSDQTYKEKRLFESAVDRLAQEAAVVLDIPKTEAVEMIQERLATQTKSKDGVMPELSKEFTIDEQIIYPGHGVGQIVAINEQEVAGQKLELYIISFSKDKMTLKVPRSKVEKGAIRKLVDEATVRAALDAI